MINAKLGELKDICDYLSEHREELQKADKSLIIAVGDNTSGGMLAFVVGRDDVIAGMYAKLIEDSKLAYLEATADLQ